jgi:hypothetical protein
MVTPEEVARWKCRFIAVRLAYMCVLVSIYLSTVSRTTLRR